jgi:GDP-4-dehydro-6-deoxy-D-mannose reductase
MIKILVTGANGFVGRHLINFLSSKKNDIYIFTSLKGKSRNSFNINPQDSIKIQKTINEIKPDYIYHLAGSTTNDIELSQIINYEYCKNIIYGINYSDLVKKTKLLVLGSAAEYGYLRDFELPVNEKFNPNPYSIYGINKLRQTNLVLNFSKNHSLQGVVLRPFTLLGIGMPSHLAIGNFEKQLLNIYKNKSQPIITSGNLKNYRDYIDIIDFINIMYLAMIEAKTTGEVINVCSGNPVKIEDILDYMIQSIGIQIKKIVSINQFREFDMPVHYGSNKKLNLLLRLNKFKNWTSSVDQIIYNIKNT